MAEPLPEATEVGAAAAAATGGRSRSTYRRFRSFLQRISSVGPRDVDDDVSISHFPTDRPAREEELITSQIEHMPTTDDAIAAFLATGHGGQAVPVFESIAAGVSHCGWQEIPTEPGSESLAMLGSGKFGEIHLAYRMTDQPVPLDARHLAAVKVQPKPDQQLDAREVLKIWQEIMILRGCVSEHIVDYLDHFIVQDDAMRSIGRFTVCILLECASAGHLSREIRRYKEGHLPQSGARYYALHIAAGLRHLHQRLVRHADLHEENILLKYRPDGSKIAILCDFGLSRVHDNGQEFSGRGDIRSLCFMIDLMLRGLINLRRYISVHLGPEAKQVTELKDLPLHRVPATIDDMLQLPWFRGKAKAPFPRPPTPMLPSETIHAMGYQDPPTPAPGWSRVERSRRRIASIPGQVKKRVQSLFRRRSPSPSDPSSSSEYSPTSSSPADESAPVSRDQRSAGGSGSGSGAGRSSGSDRRSSPGQHDLEASGASVRRSGFRRFAGKPIRRRRHTSSDSQQR